MRMTPPTLRLAALVATVAIGACSANDDSGTDSATALTTSTASSVSTNDFAEGSGCTPGTDHLPDGIWYGMVVDSGAGDLEFDLICWFVGDAAIAAAAEDGEPPPNDFYVRNASTRIRRLPIAEDTPVVWYGMDRDPLNPETIRYADWRVLEEERICCGGVWVTVSGGVVTRLAEQWVA